MGVETLFVMDRAGLNKIQYKSVSYLSYNNNRYYLEIGLKQTTLSF